jgi:hypothetical protein
VTTQRKKRILRVLAVAAGLYVVVTAALAVAVFRAGMIVVRVREAGPGGDRISIRVPAILVHAGLRVVPDEAFGCIQSDVRRWHPVILAVGDELRHCPDCVLVEVRSLREHVRIEKRGRHLQLEIESDHESVHLQLPVRMVGAVMERIARVRNPVREPVACLQARAARGNRAAS